MARIISQLWHGNLKPVERSVENNSEIKQLEELMQRNLKNLETHLNETTKEILEKYIDCVNEYILVTNEQAFCEGFCLGIRITTEALTETEEIF